MIPESNELRVEVTTRCNYHCVICPRDELTRRQETMPFERFALLVDRVTSETGQYDTLTFPGMGEPLLDPGLDEKIRHAKGRGFTVLMLTNGSLLTPERFRRLEAAGLDSLRVSLYGHSPEAYAAVHGVKDPATFGRVRDALTAIAAAPRRTRLLLTFNIVAGRNEADLEPWIAYWRERADLVEVWRPHNWGQAKHFRAVQARQLATCGRPWKTPLQVQVDGTVNMCCFDFNGALTLGDLKTQSLAEIFSAAPIRAIRARHESGDFAGSGLICEECDQRNADKSDVMIFNSRYSIPERVHQLSTTYHDLR